MRLKKRVEELEKAISSLINRVRTLERKQDELEGDFENLLEPVLEAFEKMENSASTEKENKDELEFKDIVNEWMNGKETNK